MRPRKTLRSFLFATVTFGSVTALGAIASCSSTSDPSPTTTPTPSAAAGTYAGAFPVANGMVSDFRATIAAPPTTASLALRPKDVTVGVSGTLHFPGIATDVAISGTFNIATGALVFSASSSTSNATFTGAYSAGAITGTVSGSIAGAA